MPPDLPVLCVLTIWGFHLKLAPPEFLFFRAFLYSPSCWIIAQVLPWCAPLPENRKVRSQPVDGTMTPCHIQI